jgi:hypothetical protein
VFPRLHCGSSDLRHGVTCLGTICDTPIVTQLSTGALRISCNILLHMGCTCIDIHLKPLVCKQGTMRNQISGHNANNIRAQCEIKYENTVDKQSHRQVAHFVDDLAYSSLRCVRQFQIIAGNKAGKVWHSLQKYCLSTEPKPSTADHLTATPSVYSKSSVQIVFHNAPKLQISRLSNALFAKVIDVSSNLFAYHPFFSIARNNHNKNYPIAVALR